MSGKRRTRANSIESLVRKNEEAVESVLILPPVHSLPQEQLVYAWELRYDPVTDPHKKLASYRPSDSEWQKLPLAYPGLRIVVGACGTKFGKTVGCCQRIVKEAWENEGSLNWWVAPSEKQAENAWQQIVKMLPGGRYEEQVGKSRIHVLTPEGKIWSTIEFKTGSDPSKLRGFAVNFYVMDEATQGMPEESFVSIETTTTNTDGRGIIISTPNGRGWFYDVFDRGVKVFDDGSPRYSDEAPDPYPDYISIRMPSHANPYNKLETIIRKKATMSRDNFRQEYLAQFLLESAGVFTNIQACTKGELLKSPLDGHLYVMGVDLADRNDFTVLTIMDRLERKVVAWHRFGKVGWAAQKLRIVEIAKHWNAICVIDDTGIGDPINSDLRDMGLRLFPYKISTNASKVHLIETLVVALENQTISYPNIPVLRHELEFYESKMTHSGNKVYSAPRHRHDDAVISLALATLLCMQTPGKYTHSNVRGI